MLSSQLILSGSKDKCIKLWDINTYKEIRKFTGHSRGILSLIKLNDNEFASGSGDNTIKIWSIDDNICLTTLENHENAIIYMCK